MEFNILFNFLIACLVSCFHISQQATFDKPMRIMSIVCQVICWWMFHVEVLIYFT